MWFEAVVLCLNAFARDAPSSFFWKFTSTVNVASCGVLSGPEFMIIEIWAEFDENERGSLAIISYSGLFTCLRQGSY